MTVLWLILTLPGIACAYFMFLRPILEAIPTFKTFYAEADTFWAKVWAICGKSLTMAWSYLLALLGGLWTQIDSIASALGDPNFKQQVSDFVHADPKMLGYFAMAVSAITIVARVRSITKA